MPSKKILVIGSSNTDMTVRVKQLPRPGETVLGCDFVMGQGGKGANQAVAAKRLGGDVTFVCKVGQDIFGDNSLSEYKKEGLVTDHILRSGKPSGVALIPVSADGENSIVVASGANADFSVEDVEKTLLAVGDFDILLLQLEIPVASVAAAARLAHERGAMVVLNPAPCSPLPEELFRYIDLFIPNETELSNFTGMPVDSLDEVKKACAIMQEKGVRGLIVTLGSQGSLLYAGEDSEVIPAKKVKAVDTTAAGDTFCGGLCVGLAEGKSLREAALFATAAAALTVQKAGAQNALPYRNELME